MTAVLEHRLRPRRTPTPAVDVVVPVHDEERDLGPSVRRLHAYLSDTFPVTWRITIADNASTDATPEVAAALSLELPGVRAVRIEEQGRRATLRARFSDAQCGFKAMRADRARVLLPHVRDSSSPTPSRPGCASCCCAPGCSTPGGADGQRWTRSTACGGADGPGPALTVRYSATPHG